MQSYLGITSHKVPPWHTRAGWQGPMLPSPPSDQPWITIPIDSPDFPQSPDQGEVAKDFDKSHLRLQHGKPHPNAGPRTLTKAQKGVPASIGF